MISNGRQWKRALVSLFLVFFTLGIPLIGYSQEILIPYRKGNLWGLADTFGKIKVEPQFDLEPYKVKGKNEFYYVDVKGKKGIYAVDSSFYIVPCKYGHIRMVENYFFLGVNHPSEWNSNTDSGELYTSNGVILPKYKGHVYLQYYVMNALYNKPDYMRLYQVANKKKEFDLCLYNSKTHKFTQTVFNSISNFVDWSPVDGSSSVYLTHLNSTVKKKYNLSYHKTTNTIRVAESALDDDLDMQISDKSDKGTKIVKAIRTPSLTQTKDFYIIDVRNSRFTNYFKQNRYKLRYRKSFYSFRKYKMQLVEDTLHISAVVSNEKYLNKQKLALYNIKETAAKCKKCILSYYTWQVNEHNFSYYFHQDVLRKNKYFAVSRKGKKLGIITEFGEIKPQFYSVNGIAGYNNEIPAFLVRTSNKANKNTGIVDASNFWKIKPIYDSIIPLVDNSPRGTNWIVYYKAFKDNSVLIFTHQFKLIDSLGFHAADTLNDFALEYMAERRNSKGSFLEYSLNDFSSEYLVLVRNGKFGYYFLGDYVQPQFDNLVKGFKVIGNKKVYSQYNKMGKFLGYVDLKGVYYFED